MQNHRQIYRKKMNLLKHEEQNGGQNDIIPKWNGSAQLKQGSLAFLHKMEAEALSYLLFFSFKARYIFQANIKDHWATGSDSRPTWSWI